MDKVDEEPYKRNASADTIDRGLRRTAETPLGVGTVQYLDVLPNYQGKNLIEWIEEKRKSGQVRILDIGAGIGQFALDLAEIYPSEQLSITIITHPEEVKQQIVRDYKADLPNKIVNTEEKLRQSGVKIIFEDFNRLDPDSTEKFDLIVSCYGLTHLVSYSNPRDKINQLIFSKLNKLLKDDGIAFIAPMFADIDFPSCGIKTKSIEVENRPITGRAVSFQKGK